MAAGYKWKPIEDLPEDLEPFRDPELDSLREVWREEEARVAAAGLTSDFSDRLNREGDRNGRDREGLHS